MWIGNRTGDRIEYRIFDALDGVKLIPINGGTFEINQTFEMGMGVDNCRVQVMRNSPWTVLSDDSPFPNTNGVVIVKRDGNYKTVNFSVVYAQWTGNSKQKLTSTNSEAVAKGVAVGQSLVNALATGLAAIGPEGAIPAALVLGVGSLILMAIGAQADAPPPPPNLDQITNAVRNVVADEFASNNAAECAVSFYTAANWYIGTGRSAHAQLLGKGGQAGTGDLSAHDEADFLRNLEEYVGPESTFQGNLAFIKNHPESGQYILPAFITGLATDLHLRRLHTLIRRLDGARITDEDLSDYSEQAKEAISALDKSKKSLEGFVRGKISSANLQGTPEGGGLTPIITKVYTGQNDLSFVDDAIKKLRSVESGVDSDVSSLKQGQPAKHFWKEEWSSHKRSPRHPAAA
jgi:hypothetical protein